MWMAAGGWVKVNWGEQIFPAFPPPRGIILPGKVDLGSIITGNIRHPSTPGSFAP
jgi:hypothetical protein